MRQIRWAFPILLAILAAGCDDSPSVVSIHPLYDEQTLVFEPVLMGAWRESEGVIWTFEKASKSNMYQLEIRDGADTLRFDVALVQLAGSLFLDISSRDTGLTAAPAHVFLKLRLDQEALDLTELQNNWMVKTVTGEQQLSYIRAQGKFVLTAPTRDLQYFFQRNASVPEAFNEESSSGTTHLVRLH